MSILKNYFDKVYEEPPPLDHLWSAQAAIFTFHKGPLLLHKEVDRWFSAGSYFAQHSQIVNVDYVEKTGITECAIS